MGGGGEKNGGRKQDLSELTFSHSSYLQTHQSFTYAKDKIYLECQQMPNLKVER